MRIRRSGVYYINIDTINNIIKIGDKIQKKKSKEYIGVIDSILYNVMNVDKEMTKSDYLIYVGNHFYILDNIEKID